MAYAYRKQPVKTLYWVFQLLVLVLVRLPFWFVVNIPKSTRARKSWSLKRAILVNIVRKVSDILAQTGFPIRLPDSSTISKASGVRGVWIEPINNLIIGDLKLWAQAADVSSIRIPGYWLHKQGTNIETAAPAQPGEKVILQFHGGAYIRFSAYPKDPSAEVAKGYVKEIEDIQRVFSVEYRLATAPPFKPANPFPTQLLDALAGFNYLVNVVGFTPQNIIISGDSAGGNLAHALTRYLTEYQDSTEVKLPGTPGGLILLSPWIDLGATTPAIPGGSATRFLNTDYIGDQTKGDALYGKTAFSGPHGFGILEANPYISPASLDPGLVVDFKKFPPTIIVAGGAEILYDSIVILKERMAKDLGDRLCYFEEVDGVHDYVTFGWHEPERINALKEINRWMQGLGVDKD
ncbi:alpha/beta-hydrolase [Pholiota conissans]|uniref:Alpha/beta-hydrolase n=1 Tax=Pholiota conissans TaxID=109636 RepID=A0A9P6D818_9AGAR|nr:alpha/beta-hydrolase [Pholiota conissans]